MVIDVGAGTALGRATRSNVICCVRNVKLGAAIEVVRLINIDLPRRRLTNFQLSNLQNHELWPLLRLGAVVSSLLGLL